MTHKTS